MKNLSANALGAVFMMLSMLGFVGNDAFMKFVLLDINLFQSIFIRGLFATTLMAVLCWWMGSFQVDGGIPNALRHRLVLWRTIGEIGATYCFLSALRELPIANVTAVLQLLPLTITLGAALFLGEHVGWRRYLAIIVGFSGVLLIVRPGPDGFDFYALYALGAVLFVTLRDLTTRRLPTHIPSLLVSLVTATTVTMLGGIGSLFATWDHVSPTNLVMMMAAAFILMAGYIFSILAMRDGEVSFISPFRYTILVWAILIGLIVFDEVPDSLALLGSTIVVGSGLFSFYREQIQKARAPNS